MKYTYVQPGRVFGNIYFVGVEEASTHLIDTGDGLIVIDAGLDDNLDTVIQNTESLGFSIKDIKIILLSHGHYDHAGGAKKLRELTGAKIYLGAGDLGMVNGTEDTSLSPKADYSDANAFTPDVLLFDGDTVSLGNTEIHCFSTPGHTDGTMSFFFHTFDGKRTLRAGMHGGVGKNTLTTEFLRTNGLPLSRREKYINGLKYVRNQQVDVFLGNHVQNNDTVGKLRQVAAGNVDAFVCPGAWQNFIDEKIARMEQIIRDEKENQKRLKRVIDGKVVAIVRGLEEKDVFPTVQALCDGGIRAVEFTFDASGRISDSTVAGYIKKAVEHFGDKMLVGAGTVLHKSQVALVKEAGGLFIISPDTNAEVIKRTKSLGLLSFPGAFTPSEAVTAYHAGADMVKIFPITKLGPKYLSDITAPLSHINFMAVGGVDAENAREFLLAGALCLGIGSSVVKKSLIAEGKFDEIKRLAEKLMNSISEG